MQLEMVETPSIIKRIIESYRGGYSPIIEVCGKMRVGKTTKAFITANWLSWLLFNKPWDWRNGTVIDVEAFAKALLERDEGNIYVMDEVQKQLSKKKVWSSPSQLMDDLISSQAYKHYIMFLIIPKAWQLGTDHITSVNYVMPWHNKSLCMPYRVDTPFWNIALKKKEPKIFPLSHFKLSIKDKFWKEVFKDELIEQPEFITHIEKHLKQRILSKAVGIEHDEAPIPATTVIKRDV